jgi:hypothetical protein
MPFGGINGQAVVYQWSGSEFVHAGSHYGLTLDMLVAKNCHVQMSYTRQNSNKETYPLGTGIKHAIVIDRLQAGFGYGKQFPKTPVSWLAGIDLGGATIKNTTNNLRSTRFAVNFKITFFYKISESVDFMTQGQIMEIVGPIQPASLPSVNFPIMGRLTILTQPALSFGFSIRLGKANKLGQEKLKGI